MTSPRFFIDTQLKKGLRLVLPDNVSHHLLNVLRFRLGDTLVLFNGRGGEFQAILQAASKKSASVEIIGGNSINRSANIKLDLGLCVLKRDAMDRAIARSVELGINRLTPLISEHCAVAHSIIENRYTHWQQVIISASEQCGLNVLPSLTPALTLENWLRDAHADQKLIATPGGSTLPDNNKVESVALVTGPEGGFAEAELNFANKAGFTPLGLGDRILRGENAPAVALSTIHRTWGDFSN